MLVPRQAAHLVFACCHLPAGSAEPPAALPPAQPPACLPLGSAAHNRRATLRHDDMRHVEKLAKSQHICQCDVSMCSQVEHTRQCSALRFASPHLLLLLLRFRTSCRVGALLLLPPLATTRSVRSRLELNHLAQRARHAVVLSATRWLCRRAWLLQGAKE